MREEWSVRVWDKNAHGTRYYVVNRDGSDYARDHRNGVRTFTTREAAQIVADRMNGFTP